MHRILSLSSPRLSQFSMLALAFLISRLAFAAPMKPLGAFEQHLDIGNPKRAGNAAYSPSDQTYTLSSAGPNVGTALEQLHLAWKKLKGDFILQASVRFAGTGTRGELGI